MKKILSLIITIGLLSIFALNNFCTASNIIKGDKPMKVTKAIIPAAGLGTRVLPATKALPKEMLTIVDKPAIQYLVEEAINSGITDILVITNRGKGIIEDHFDRCPELETKLLDSNKFDLYDEVVNISNLANVYFIRQKETKGLGHAIRCAKSFVGNDPFAVLYGDDVVYSENSPACKQLIDVFEKYSLPVLGVKPVSKEDICKYSSLKVDHVEKNIYKCTDMIEKPKKGEEMSLYSILGRCILTPEIFDILDNTKPGSGNEIQLTDAIKVIAQNSGTMAVEYEGVHYEMGNKLGIMKAQVEYALRNREIGQNFKDYLKNLVNKI